MNLPVPGSAVPAYTTKIKCKDTVLLKPAKWIVFKGCISDNHKNQINHTKITVRTKSSAE
jgi:hypothetical protein